MGRTFKRILIDSITEKEIREHREKLMKVGITDQRFLSDNKIIKFMAEKSKRNNKLISINEILRILQQ